jgi:pimeloyl-ACP methyl ester carboxylesterase
MRALLSIFAIAAAAYAGLCAWLYATQRTQIYFRTPASDHPGAQPLWLESEGERVKVWSVLRDGPRALIYFGGNAEDVAGNIDVFAAMFPEHSLYLVNYRGYGGSGGQPSESALQADALAVHAHVRAAHREVALMGRSLGAGVAVYLASERPVVRLILVTPFDSLASVAQSHMRWLPVRWLLRDRYDSAIRAHSIRAPVLVVIAAEDEIIPRARTDALVSEFRPGQVRVVVIAGASHNTLDLSPKYLQSVRAFLPDP